MHSTDFISLVGESKVLNSKVFSLTRLQLLANIACLQGESATYRELKAGLQLSDGALFSNLKVLEKMGYLKLEKVQFEGKELDAYKITLEGLEEWKQVRNWLSKFVEVGGE